MCRGAELRTIRSRTWRLAHAAFAVALMLSASGALRAQSDDPGHFEVRTARQELIDGVYYVDARIYLRLSTEAANALRSGLPLTIRIEAEFLHRLRLWWDTTTVAASRRSQLRYLRVTDRYVVYDLESGQGHAFKTLDDALDYLGRVDRLPVVGADELDEDDRYDIRVRAVLDKTDLPGALALFAFMRRDWSIASDWLTWRLDNE
jgi:Domain of unknown function (DUF4390)